MNRDAVLHQFDALNVWSRAGQRAPHKPLLVLYALGRWVRGETGDIPFAEVNRDLAALLQEFGPPRRTTHPEYPFWRLQNDGVWVVSADGTMKPRQSNSDPPRGELLAHHTRAGFADGVKAVLQADPGLVGTIASRQLENHFPDSLHPDILAAVGLDTVTATAPAACRKRDPKFRQRVLTAYEYRCAVCGFDVRLGSLSVAIDAAHIRWHQAAGPDREDNGLALCVMHHKLFDLGAFTLDRGGLLLVSDQVHGTVGFQESLMRHHGDQVRKPQRSDWAPAAGFLEWHGREVFKGEARQRGPGGVPGAQDGVR
jgi:putative restriction endonuclease